VLKPEINGARAALGLISEIRHKLLKLSLMREGEAGSRRGKDTRIPIRRDFLDDEDCLTVACGSSERHASMILITRQSSSHPRPLGTLREQKLFKVTGDDPGAKRLGRER
jgi:hypothetical protein